MTLKILQYPHPALRAKAPLIINFNDALRNSIKQMFDLMYQSQGCGLAATQVGLPLRFFVMDVSKNQDKPLCFINPEIINTKGEYLSEEGCLSFPGVYAKVLRSQEVSVRYQDEFGIWQLQTFDGLGAYCIQHEIEHLDGFLFIDRLSKLKRMILLKKLEKLQRIAS